MLKKDYESTITHTPTTLYYQPWETPNQSLSVTFKDNDGVQVVYFSSLTNNLTFHTRSSIKINFTDNFNNDNQRIQDYPYYYCSKDMDANLINNQINITSDTGYCYSYINRAGTSQARSSYDIRANMSSNAGYTFNFTQPETSSIPDRKFWIYFSNAPDTFTQDDMYSYIHCDESSNCNISFSTSNDLNTTISADINFANPSIFKINITPQIGFNTETENISTTFCGSQPPNRRII